MSQKGQYTTSGGIASELNKLTPDAGGFVSAVAKNINLLGSTNISTVGNPGTATINLYLTGTTDHCIQVGNLSGGITSLAAATNGQVLLGVTGGDPVFANLTSAGGTIAFTHGAGTLNLEALTASPATTIVAGISRYATDAEAQAGVVSNATIVPTSLASKLGAQTIHGLPIGASSVNPIAWTAEPSDGQLLIGATGATPALATISEGDNITVTNGANSITISVNDTTEHAVQVGNASGSLTSLAVGTDGQVLLGGTGVAPAFATLTSSGGTITFTPGANTLNIESNSGVQATEVVVGITRYATDAEAEAGVVTDAAIVPTSLAAKLGAQTIYGLPIGASSISPITWTANPTDGQILIGATLATPALATISEGDNITVTNAANSITVSVSDTTEHAVQIGNAAGSLTSMDVGITGQVIVGNTGADPSWTASPSITGTLTAGTSVKSILFDTNVAAAKLQLGGTTITCTGSDANVGLTITPKGTGGLTLTTGTATLSSGNLVLTSGNATLTSGNIVVTSGNLTLTSGNATLTAGDLTLSSGVIKLPTTSSTVGQIQINSSRVLHSYGTSNIFVGANAGNLTFNTAVNTLCTAIGVEALASLAGASGNEGQYNTAVGYHALNALTSGYGNCALGVNAGDDATTIEGSTLIGWTSGTALTTGSYNTFVGTSSGNAATTGTYNVSLGYRSAYSSFTTGSYNIMLGAVTGDSATTSSSSNIYLGYNLAGAAESNVLRIGNATGSSAGNLNKAYVCGVYNTAVGATAGVVLADSSNQIGGLAGSAGTVLIGGTKPSFSASPSLTTVTATTVNATTFDTNVAAAGVTLVGTTLAADGTDANIDINITPKGSGAIKSVSAYNKAVGATNRAMLVDDSGYIGNATSSLRFKENVQDMANRSDFLYDLRPVTFNYKNDKEKREKFGLIAEEVAAIYPGLASFDENGEPYTVSYHELPTLLLNEIQKQQRKIEDLTRRIIELERSK